MDLPKWTYDNVLIIYSDVKWTYDLSSKKVYLWCYVSSEVVFKSVFRNIYRGIVYAI